jgi:hypothetical protein
MGKAYKLIKAVRKGGFGLSEMVITDRLPDKVEKISDNKVIATYGSYRQIWTAEGSGNERHNFKEVIEEVGSDDSS